MSSIAINTSIDTVKNWFKDQGIQFCHLVMRITIDGKSGFAQFNYLPEDKHKEYVDESNKHFKKHCSLIYRAKFDYYFSNTGKISDKAKENNQAGGESACSWGTSEISIPLSEISKTEVKVKADTGKRRAEYREILTTVYPALAGENLYALAYCELADSNEVEGNRDDKDENIGDKDTGYGLAVFYVNNKTGDKDENKNFADTLFRNCLLELSSQLISNMKQQAEELEKQRVKVEDFRTETRKAAISQIMNRQMSHNINSHVLAKLTNLYSYDNKKMRVFLGYLKNRIEFIADIVTSQPLVTFPSRLYGGVVKRFFTNRDTDKEWPRYLIQYISGSDEVTYKTNKNAKKNIDVTFEGDKETIVALPNDILGAQAFYVILENIIRNSVKHSVIPDVSAQCNGRSITKKLLKLTIVLDEEFKHNDYHKIIIRDNLGEANSIGREEKKYGNDNNLTFVEWMNHKVDRDILEDERLRQNDWGFLEMKICSTYLRKFPLENLDNKSCNPKLLNITLDEDKNLGHEFYLLKPKLACIVMNNIPDDINNVAEMEERGIHLVKKCDLGDLDRLLKYGNLKLVGKEQHIVSHKYLILEKDVLEGEEQVKSNQIVVELSQEDILALCSQEDVELAILKHMSPCGVTDMVRYTWSHNALLEADKQKIIFHDHPVTGLDLNEASFSDALYYESYGTSSATQKIVDYCLDENQNDSALKYELHLATKLNVGILDERIQAEVCRDDKVNQTLGLMNIHIPNSKRIDLNRNDFHKAKGRQTQTIAEKIHAWVEEEKKEKNYIIIHQGIIEKTMRRTSVVEINKFITQFYQDENTSAELIIISGRGKPSNLPEDVFYLPFSLVNQYVITYRSKIYLYQLLKSARRYHG